MHSAKATSSSREGCPTRSARATRSCATPEYADRQFNYVLLEEPAVGFDLEWQHKDVSEAKVPGSRFSHGLPGKGDGQMLFLGPLRLQKFAPAGTSGHGGRAAVVSNASPSLFTSDKGPNAIRQWLFDEDLIDAIIALPTQMFYDTGIATYVWILDTNKEPEAPGQDPAHRRLGPVEADAQGHGRQAP